MVEQRGCGGGFTLFWLLLWGGCGKRSRGRRGRGGVGGWGGGWARESALELRGHEDVLLALPSTLRQTNREMTALCM